MSVAVKPSARTSQRKVRLGVVVSDRMQKTIVVQVRRLVRHPVFPRVVKRVARFMAHDETNSAKRGDWVKIMETRPLSKDKRWRLLEILRRGSTAPAIPGAEEGPANEASETA